MFMCDKENIFISDNLNKGMKVNKLWIIIAIKLLLFLIDLNDEFKNKTTHIFL